MISPPIFNIEFKCKWRQNQQRCDQSYAIIWFEQTTFLTYPPPHYYIDALRKADTTPTTIPDIQTILRMHLPSSHRLIKLKPNRWPGGPIPWGITLFWTTAGRAIERGYPWGERPRDAAGWTAEKCDHQPCHLSTQAKAKPDLPLDATDKSELC
jgi:hypothetical protein